MQINVIRLSDSRAHLYRECENFACLLRHSCDTMGDVYLADENDIIAVGELWNVENYGDGLYMYHFRNVRKIVEVPLRDIPKDEIVQIDYDAELTEYPTMIALDDKGWQIIMKNIRKNDRIRRFFRKLITFKFL